MRNKESLCKVVLKALYANLLICVFLQVPSLYSVKKVTWVTFAPASVLKLTLFFEAPMSVLEEQAAVPQFTYVCAIIFCTFFCSLILSVLYQTFFATKKNFFCIHLILGQITFYLCGSFYISIGQCYRGKPSTQPPWPTARKILPFSPCCSKDERDFFPTSTIRNEIGSNQEKINIRVIFKILIYVN